MDDETILSYGAIRYFKDKNYDVHILTFCGNGRKDSQDLRRKDSYEKILKSLNVTYNLYYHVDLNINKTLCQQQFERCLKEYQPTIVITHSCSDLHFEHKMLGEMSLLVCRKTQTSSVKQLLHIQSVVSNWSYNCYKQFNPNYFIDITNYMQDKCNALKMYSMEIPNDSNDLRSIDSITAHHFVNGSIINVKYAEAYEQIFRIENEISN